MINLPHPATSSEAFAHATVVELRRLNDNIERITNLLQGALSPVEAEPTDEVELKEPAKKPATRDAKQAADKPKAAVGPVTVETVTEAPLKTTEKVEVKEG